MNNEALKLKKIYDLLGYQFFIPDYQRGYRWNPLQVEQLLEDIWEFVKDHSKKHDAFYCLQPVVVKNRGDSWEVIDGQQRLTTIQIILRFLEQDHLRRPLEEVFSGNSIFEIEYETRPGSQKFLNNIHETSDNIDFFHIWNAYKTIASWFKTKDYNDRDDLMKVLLSKDDTRNAVKVIWYPIGEEVEPVKIFTRINIGKIPLTNAELIKALFLKSGNFETESTAELKLKQLEIATEWDRIENTLQRPSFWYFIHDNGIQYDTRIEFIFDLIKEKNRGHSENYTFLKFSEDFNSKKKSIQEVWLEVKQCFMRLEEWYEDHELYHLIGFLVSMGSRIQVLIKKSNHCTKTDFKVYLRKLIGKNIKEVEVEDIRYKDPRVKYLLLLFNIETILENTLSPYRFPFDLFRKEKWEIEHISAIAEEDYIPPMRQSRAWLEELHDYFDKIISKENRLDSSHGLGQLKNKVEALLQKADYSEEEFRTLYRKVTTFFSQLDTASDEDKDFIHTLGNLTLLDSSTNRSYKNAVFPVKRKTIIENDQQGKFIPIGTKNVFLKYYTEGLSEPLYWNKGDADKYLKKIETTLSKYTKA